MDKNELLNDLIAAMEIKSKDELLKELDEYDISYTLTKENNV
ncbi:hypothetical protein [Clostridium perfringens]|nr:hypothetical protein [Clostridium perfringens]MDM0719749.1 hypothetical protein [Clostridium perfringens]MDM0935897.1 hypothetical protein [Clostridium perfringens]